MPTVTLEGPHVLSFDAPIWDLSPHFVDGIYAYLAIPDAAWKLYMSSPLFPEATGFLVTNPAGQVWGNPPPPRLYPFGTLIVDVPTTPQFGFGPGGVGPFIPIFNYDTKVAVHPTAGTGIDDFSPFPLILVLTYGEFICWQLSYKLTDGRSRKINGPGRHPSVITVPEPNMDIGSCILVEDGEIVHRRRYRVMQGVEQ